MNPDAEVLWLILDKLDEINDRLDRLEEVFEEPGESRRAVFTLLADRSDASAPVDFPRPQTASPDVSRRQAPPAR